MIALNFALTRSMALNLRGVMMLDRDDELAQQVEELRGGGIGEPR